MEKLNIPQGIAKVSHVETTGIFLTMDDDLSAICKVYDNPITERFTEDVSSLFIDALNTYNQTPVLPSELLRQLNEAKEIILNFKNKVETGRAKSTETYAAINAFFSKNIIK